LDRERFSCCHHLPAAAEATLFCILITTRTIDTTIIDTNMKASTSLLVPLAVLAFPEVEGLSILRSHQARSHHRHLRLFAVPNSKADVNASLKLASGKPNTTSGRKSAGGKSEIRQLRPHAPKTPRPSAKDDKSVLEHANQLLDIHEASKSPTRRITDEDFYQSSSKHHLHSIDTDITVGPKPYATSVELLRDSKRRAMKLMSRSNFEKEKAEEKKARIMARIEEELKEVENGLKLKLDMALAGIENDVSVILCCFLLLDLRRLYICLF
jgi:hypothetical protein